MPSMILSEPTIKMIISSTSNVIFMSAPLAQGSISRVLLSDLGISDYRTFKRCNHSLPPHPLGASAQSSSVKGSGGGNDPLCRNLMHAVRKAHYFNFTPYTSAMIFISLLTYSLISLGPKWCTTRPAFSTCLRYSGSFSISLRASFHLSLT